MLCLSYSKDGEKPEKINKVCKYYFLLNFKANQFPRLQIVEITNDFNDLLPHFNKFVTNLFSNMK